MLPRQQAMDDPFSRTNRPKLPGAIRWAVVAGTSVFVLLAGLLAGGWPWGAACGLVLGGIAGWAVLAAWANGAAPPNPAQQSSPTRLHAQRDAAPEAPHDAPRAADAMPLFDATRPIPPLDPNLLALSSADQVASRIQEDTKRFRQGAGAA